MNHRVTVMNGNQIISQSRFATGVFAAMHFEEAVNRIEPGHVITIESYNEWARKWQTTHSIKGRRRE